MVQYIDDLLVFIGTMDSFQRLMALWAFCLGGILVAVQVSQLGEDDAISWTKLTPRLAPFWYAFYLLEAIFFLTGAYPLLLSKMDNLGLFTGFETQVLNGFWLTLVGIEVLMVAWAMFAAVTRSSRPGLKQKTQ